MYRRVYTSKPIRTRRGFSAFLRRPAVQLAILLFVALVVYLIALAGRDMAGALKQKQLGLDEALALYQSGVYVLDVSWAPEYAEYHLPNSVNIPLDILFQRMAELPKDRRILVVARQPQSSLQAVEMLNNAGFNATAMNASTAEWFVKGYPIEGAPPQ